MFAEAIGGFYRQKNLCNPRLISKGVFGKASGCLTFSNQSVYGSVNPGAEQLADSLSSKRVFLLGMLQAFSLAQCCASAACNVN